MFGLHQPLSKSLSSAEFDGINAILYNSSLTEPSHWLSKVNKNGEIFHLELQDPDASDTGLSDKDCLCSCSDCATDDTGYGTDTDLYASFRKIEEDIHNCQVDKVLTEFSDVDDILQWDDKASYSAPDAVNAFSQAEGNIDSLFQSYNCHNPIDMLSSENPVIPYDIDKFFSSRENQLPNKHTAKITHSVEKLSMEKSIPTETTQSLNVSRVRKPKGDKCHCAEKQEKFSKSDKTVTVKLKSQVLKDEVQSTVQLCEAILGIIPGHFGSGQGSGSSHRRRDRRVKIRGLVPTGVAARYADIHVGDCLMSINDQEVTWDNLESIVRVLQHQRQATFCLRRNSKQRSSTGSGKKHRAQSKCTRLVQLVSGSNNSVVSLEEVLQGDWEPFYGAMYLSLDGVSSDNMQAKEDIVYQFPRVDNKVIDSRGMFITLAGSMQDATQSTVQSTTLTVDNQNIHVVYHNEGPNLLVISVPESRLSLPALTSLVKDLVLLLQLIHGSIHQAFSSPANHSQLDCFFALLHMNQVTKSENTATVSRENCNLSQSVKILPLPNEIKMCCDITLTEFEAADFGDMSDSYYGCRRSYSVLGTCLFYKDYLMTNHLPRDDLVDFSTYLRYHALLSLTCDQSLGQLVIWKEVFPTRHCQSVPEEQSFGYTEPLRARWFWLIVGFKHMIMCVMLEAGGCTAVKKGVSAPDPFLIDQARTVLMQLDSQDVPTLCQNSISQPVCPLVTSPDLACQELPQRRDLISRSLKKLPHRDNNTQPMPSASFSENHSSFRRILQRRKDSVGSDNSSESSGESFFKFSRKGRIFPDATESLHNICESKEDTGPMNACRKLTVGVENCLYHFQYFDNLEGVFISSGQDLAQASPLSKEVYCNFTRCCQKLKKVFDNARKIKEQIKYDHPHVLGLNDDFSEVREEGVMFTCSHGNQEKKTQPLCYWVAGRCLSRSLRREVYVCFQDGSPQTTIELAFKLALGYLPL